jgi:O-phosphoseryl-tRNA synthetase
MKKLNPQEIVNKVKKEGFEKVWAESTTLLPKTQAETPITWITEGRPHPVQETSEHLRQLFLKIGFNEVVNPFVVEEVEIYKQYGPEAPIILDRCYYLATLPRPDVGLSKEKCLKIESLGVPLDQDKTDGLQDVLRGYKKGDIDADDLIEELAKKLQIPDEKAVRIIREVFPEFTVLRPQPTNLTVRSHMTSVWFETLKALQHKLELPIRLFSVGLRLRREQTEDPTHLRAHTVASCVLMGEEANVEMGKMLSTRICKELGFEEVKFVRKEITPKYYAPGTDHECFVYLKSAQKYVEVLEFGLYSPIALANYGLEYSVLNIGLGVERMAMLIEDETDIRRLVYPQFYQELNLSDEELAKAVNMFETPKTALGEEVRDAIIGTALRYAEEKSPCEFEAFKKENLTVSVYEPDPNTRLLGPASLNTVYAYDGNLLGIPEKGLDHIVIVKEARQRGISTKLRYLDAVASQAASQIENMIKEKRTGEYSLRVKMAKLPSDVNIKVSSVAERYITSAKKRIDVRGPAFIGIKATLK